MIRPFLTSDLDEINRWYAARGFSGVADHHIPQTGYIVPGVAVGFLYVTDSSVALLDGYVTNPEAGLRERSRAVDEITERLFTEASGLGCRSLFAMCLSGGVSRRAHKHGLRGLGTYQLAAREV